MDLELPVYDVFLAGPGVAADRAAETGEFTCHRVTVLHADQLRAEITGQRLTGVAEIKEAPMTYTTLWCWLALTRSGELAPGGSFDDFKARVVQLRKHEDGGPAVTVPPTLPGDPMPSD